MIQKAYNHFHNFTKKNKPVQKNWFKNCVMKNFIALIVQKIQNNNILGLIGYT